MASNDVQQLREVSNLPVGNDPRFVDQAIPVEPNAEHPVVVRAQDVALQ